MATNVGEFLKQIASKAGIDTQQNQEFQQLLQKQELQQLELSDETAQQLNQNLLNLEAAKNNSDLQKHFFSQFADDLDRNTIAALKNAGYDESKFKELQNQYPKAAERIPKTLELLQQDYDKKIKELQEKGGGNEKDKEKLQHLNQQIEQLQSQLKEKDQSIEQTKQQYEQQLQQVNVQRKLDSILDQYPLNSSLPQKYRRELAEKAIWDTAKQQQAEIREKDGQLVVVDQNNPEAIKYNKNHEPITAEAIVENALKENELIEKSGGNNPQPQPQTGGSANPQPERNGQNGNSDYERAILREQERIESLNGKQ